MNHNINLVDKYKSIPVQVKTSFWFFFCSIAQKAISVLSTAVFTRMMSTEDFGLVSIYNSWSDIFVMIASLNLAVGCFNVGMTRYDNDRKTWVSSLQILSAISAFLFSCIYMILYPIWNQYIKLPFICIFIMVVTFFTIPALNLWTAKQRYEYSYRKLVFVSLTYSIAIFVFSLMGIILFENKGVAKIVATAVVTSVIGSFLFLSNIGSGEAKYNKNYVIFAARYNICMMPAFLATFLLNQIDRVMIDWMVGRDVTGIYSVSYNAAYMIIIVNSAINATYNPWMMRKVKNSDFSKTATIGTSISSGLMITIIAFILLAPEFVKIIASKDYYDAIYIIPAVAGSTYFSLIYCLYCPIAQYYLKVKQLAFVNVLAAIANVVLNYFGIKEYGYIAAGYTTYICYFIYGWGTAVYSIYLMKEKHITTSIYNTKMLIVHTAILTIVTVIAPFLYYGYVVRFILLALILVGLGLFGKKYLDIIMELKKG